MQINTNLEEINNGSAWVERKVAFFSRIVTVVFHAQVRLGKVRVKSAPKGYNSPQGLEIVEKLL